MDLSKITLKQITPEEFINLGRYWNYNQPIRVKYTARILNSLIFGSYADLIKSFLEHPDSNRIGVIHNRKWVHYKPHNASPECISEIERIANGDGLKRDHLELQFRHHKYDCKHDTTVRFVEREGEIIIHALSFSTKYKDDFSWKEIPLIDEGRVTGLWVPETANL